MLWSRVRSRQLGNYKFRRQVWLGGFIADFFCAEAKLVVEIDGDSHADQVHCDERRTAWLASQGFRVVRFSNIDVMSNIDGVLQQLLAYLPSPPRRLRRPGPSLSP